MFKKVLRLKRLRDVKKCETKNITWRPSIKLKYFLTNIRLFVRNYVRLYLFANNQINVAQRCVQGCLRRVAKILFLHKLGKLEWTH